MVALGRSCRSTSSISQSMKLQSPPPSSASAARENGAKGRRVIPGRARTSAATAASAASPSGGPATPSSIPAPARPRRLSPLAHRILASSRLPAPRLTPSRSRRTSGSHYGSGRRRLCETGGPPRFPAAPRPPSPGGGAPPYSALGSLRPVPAVLLYPALPGEKANKRAEFSSRDLSLPPSARNLRAAMLGRGKGLVRQFRFSNSWSQLKDASRVLGHRIMAGLAALLWFPCGDVLKHIGQLVEISV